MNLYDLDVLYIYGTILAFQLEFIEAMISFLIFIFFSHSGDMYLHLEKATKTYEGRINLKV